jgi:hypothetical protein
MTSGGAEDAMKSGGAEDAMTSGGAGAIRAAAAPDASFSASFALRFASTTTAAAAAATEGVAKAARWRFGGAPADDRHAAVAGGLPAPSSDASDKERARLCRRSRDWGGDSVEGAKCTLPRSTIEEAAGAEPFRARLGSCSRASRSAAKAAAASSSSLLSRTTAGLAPTDGRLGGASLSARSRSASALRVASSSLLSHVCVNGARARFGAPPAAD